jgi:phosphatidylserine/phosphatidylglycerophosphate/cardiolipin synthase-like enzyme
MAKVKARAYCSPTVVLLAMDWPEGNQRDDFLGFAIQRTPGFRKPKLKPKYPHSWLPNRIGFNGPPGNGKDLPSNVAPIQKFMWWDARIDTEDRGKKFTYEITPVVKPWTNPKLVNAAATAIDVTIPHVQEKGIGTYFNRAVVSSQAFVKEFGTNPKGAKRDKALLWLANGLEEIIPGFIKNAKQIDCAIYHLTDRNWVIKALKAYKRPATVACHYKAPTAKTKGDTANDGAMGTLKSSANIQFRKRTKTNLMHNKFVVSGDGNGSPDALLMGSANFTEEGLTSQANLLHTWDSPKLAALYLERQKILFADKAKAATAKLAGWSNKITIGDAKVRVYFPPETKPGRDSIDRIVDAIKHANSSVMFCLFSSTDQPLRDACFAAADAGKMMFGLVNSITLPKDPTKKDAQTTAMVEIYNRSKDDKDVFSHALFPRGKEPQGFWWEVATLRPKEPDTTADMIDAGVAAGGAAKKKSFIPAVYIHHKFVVIDAETTNPKIYSGSANLSGNSCWNNDENLLEITGSPRLGQLYLSEFMRLYEHYRARAAYNRRVAEGDTSTFKLEKDPGWSAQYYQPGTPEFKSRSNMVMAV